MIPSSVVETVVPRLAGGNPFSAIGKGHIVEDGTHSHLLAQPDGLYAMLWRMQSDTVAG